MKLNEFIDWCVIVFIALLLWLQAACGGQSNTPPMPPSIHAVSLQGISVRVEDGTTPDGELLRKLDSDAQKVFDKLTELGKAGFPTHRGITVKIMQRSAKCDEPALLIETSCERVSNCGAYDGGVFDKDGLQDGKLSLCAAGQFVESSDTIFVTREGTMTGEAFKNEVEHWVLYHFDRAWYLRTRDHYGDGSIHPIIK